MTDSIARIKARAATRARMDLKGTSATRTGKTRRKINCKPPNVKCGGRCIPPSWDCRLEGKGTNSELKSHQYDPLGGVASVERGIKTIAKNPTDPQSLDRGRNSIIRGIVKATPGDNLEQKKKLKRNLQKYGNQIGAVMLLGAGAIGAHQAAKRLNSSYARGLGRSIDMAAFGAVDAVLDRTPIVGGQRAAARAGGLSVARQLGRGAAIANSQEAAMMRSLNNSGRIGMLGAATTRGNFQNTKVLQGQQTLQRLVRGVDTNGVSTGQSKMTFDTWRRKAASALYGAKVQGKNSAYSEDAANRLISGQFGLRVPGALRATGQAAKSQSTRNSDVQTALATRLRGFGDTMRADMEVRRYERGKNGKFTAASIRSYVDTQVIPSMGLNRAGIPANQQNNARRKARSLAIDILTNGDDSSYRKQAAALRGDVVSEYNNYFAEASNRMSLPGASKQSTFGDGQVGLARYVMKQSAGASGRVVPVKSRSHADLILKDHFTRKVQGTPNGTFTASASTVQRVAQQLNGGRSVPDKASAYSIVQESGIRSLRAPGEAPSTGRRTKAKAPTKSSKGGLGGQRSQSDLARKIMQRASFKGTYAEALAQARRELKRSDAAEERTDAKKSAGKPCGESHIARTKECTVGKKGSGLTKEERKAITESSKKHYEPKPVNHTNAAGNRTAAYRARQLGSILARAGFVVGSGAAAYAAGKQAARTKKLSDFYAAVGFGMFAMFGAQSLKREAAVTKTTKQFVGEIEKLKSVDGVEPETVDQLSKFVTEAGIDVQRVPTQAAMMGAGGFFDTAKPNRIHTNTTQSELKQSRTGQQRKLIKGKNDQETYALAVQTMVGRRAEVFASDDRSSLIKSGAKSMEDLYEFHSGGQYIGTPKGRAFYTNVHETAHAIHYRGDFATPKSVTVKGKTYSGTALEVELLKSSSYYGQSDINRTAKGPTKDYYATGSRLETYAENYAMYVGAGKAMKKDFPVAYEWTKQTTDYALSKPTKKAPRTFASQVEDFSNSEDRRYIGDRMDAPTKAKKPEKSGDELMLDLYPKVADAAVKGDIKKVAELIAEGLAGDLPDDQISMLSDYAETARFYEVIDGRARPEEQSNLQFAEAENETEAEQPEPEMAEAK